MPATIEPAEVAEAPAAGAPVTAAGWGLTRPASAGPPGQPRSGYLSDVLLKAGLTMTDAQTCRNAIASVGLRHSGQICAGSPTGSTCNGDSGGPLMRWTNGRWAAIGLTSFGPTTCAGQTAYTTLASYITWINSWKIYQANPGSLDMRCYPIGSVTGCSLDGPLGSMYPLAVTFTAGGGTRVVYPSAGSFPYTSSKRG